MSHNTTNSDALHMAKVSQLVSTFAKTASVSPVAGAIAGGLGGGVLGGIANMKARRDVEDQYKTPHSTSNSTNFLLGGLLGGLGGAGAGYLASGGAKDLLPHNEQVQYLSDRGPVAVTGKALNALAKSESALQGGPLDQLTSSMSERTFHPASLTAGAAGVLGAAHFGHGPLAHAKRIFSKNKNVAEVDKFMAGNTTRTYGTGLTPSAVEKVKLRDPKVLDVLRNVVDTGLSNVKVTMTPAERNQHKAQGFAKIKDALKGKGNNFAEGDAIGDLFNKKENQDAIRKAQREGLDSSIRGSAKARLIPSGLMAANVYQSGQLLGNLREWNRLRNERRSLQG